MDREAGLRRAAARRLVRVQCAQTPPLSPSLLGWALRLLRWAQDDAGNTYYFNAVSQESTYDNPLDETFKFLVEKERQKNAESIAAAVAAAPMDSADAPAAAFTRPRRGGRGRGRGRAKERSAEAAAPAAPPAANAAQPAAATAAATPQVKEMAEYLGINPDTEAHLLWVAAAALQEPLPPEWQEYADDEGNRYYHNASANVTQYDHPLDAKHKATIGAPAVCCLLTHGRAC